MWALWSLISRYGVGFILRVIWNSLYRLQVARADNEAFVAYVHNLIVSLEETHGPKTGGEKFELAYQHIARYLYELGSEVKESVINGVIEEGLAEVERIKELAGSLMSYNEAQARGYLSRGA